MIMAITTQFSNGQAVTATAASTNSIDLGAVGPVDTGLKRGIGKGTAIPMIVTVVESFNNLTSLTVTLETDDNAAFSSPKLVYTSPAYPLADLGTGKRLLLPDYIPLGTDERYMRLRYVVAGTAPTTGKITAGVTMGNQTN